MHEMITRMSPGATTMIRMDHTHAMATFHKYRADATPDKKQAIAETLCLALEIHARLEEEIFYPALRSFDPDLVNKSVPEHNEMRRLISQLRQTRPEDASFDTTLMELMRGVMRHVADEETMLLPDAERVLGERRLSELGAEMTRRRFELVTPRAGEIAVNTVRTFPGATLAFSGLLVLGAYLIGRAATHDTARLPAVRSTLREAARPARIRSTSRSLMNRLRDAVAA